MTEGHCPSRRYDCPGIPGCAATAAHAAARRRPRPSGSPPGPEVRFCTTCGTGRGNEDGASSDSPLPTRSPERAQQRAHTAVAPKATTLELSAEQSGQPQLPYASARPNETKARAFFKSLGLVRTEQLLAKMAAVVEERGRGTPDKLLGAVLRKKMQVQDVATVLVEMRACSDGGKDGEITAVRALHKIESKIPAAHASHVINGKEMITPFLIHDAAGSRHGSGHGGVGNVPFLGSKQSQRDSSPFVKNPANFIIRSSEKCSNNLFFVLEVGFHGSGAARVHSFLTEMYS